jgi:hypothetical protein
VKAPAYAHIWHIAATGSRGKLSGNTTPAELTPPEMTRVAAPPGFFFSLAFAMAVKNEGAKLPLPTPISLFDYRKVNQAFNCISDAIAKKELFYMLKRFAR